MSRKISQDKFSNVYVLGLARSGTSMITKILILLGINIIYTKLDKNYCNRKYKNKFGKYFTEFYEARNNPNLWIELLSTPYSGCKIMIPIRPSILNTIKNYQSRIILVLRNPEEIRRSQIHCFGRSRTAIYFKDLLIEEEEKLQENNIDYLPVQYRDILNNPVQEINRIKEFIKSDADITEAVKWVDPEGIHFKIEDIKKGETC